MRNLAEIRSQFPALKSGTAFLENAGGSQAPIQVIDRISNFLTDCNVQLGASYPQSVAATEIVAQAHQMVNNFAGGDESYGTVLGASTTALCFMLADCFSRELKPGDAIILPENGHEANINPWLRLEEKGIEIRWWKIDREAGDCTLETLSRVLDEKVKLVAVCQVSNLLGGIHDLSEICRMAHAVGAQVVADGVAFAPHLPMTVAEWDVDFYVFSTYKVFGPHLAAMIGKRSAWAELRGANHFFIKDDYFPGKFQPGSVGHEGCAGILGSLAYFDWLGVDGYATIATNEQVLTRHLIEFLATHSRYQLVGPTNNRVSTISFTHKTLSPSHVVET
ncbi:MAG: aminotransferase class V-fold PLP-dependent enzyme, partial [Armatimonadetes bacterium]|nr:aminotransferase class V-fold PLP-dependent enzyme [Armatimonadota bacterium]